MIHVLVALFFVAGSLAHPSSLCPDVSTVANFDKYEYIGKWYEQARYNHRGERDLKCVIIEYNLIDEDRSINMLNYGINNVTGAPASINVIATALNDKEDASKFSVIFPSLPGKPRGSYWILDTDYKNYSLVYACNPKTGWRSVWILTRQQIPDPAVVKKLINDAIEKTIATDKFELTDQTNCDN